VVGRASAAQQLLDAELVDELRVDIMPVFLGTGRRFVDNASLERVRLEKIDALEIGARTTLRFRVKH
jgi:dihydrofolate reductase